MSDPSIPYSGERLDQLELMVLHMMTGGEQSVVHQFVHHVRRPQLKTLRASARTVLESIPAADTFSSEQTSAPPARSTLDKRKPSASSDR